MKINQLEKVKEMRGVPVRYGDLTISGNHLFKHKNKRYSYHIMKMLSSDQVWMGSISWFSNTDLVYGFTKINRSIGDVYVITSKGNKTVMVILGNSISNDSIITEEEFDSLGESDIETVYVTYMGYMQHGSKNLKTYQLILKSKTGEFKCLFSYNNQKYKVNRFKPKPRPSVKIYNSVPVIAIFPDIKDALKKIR